VATGRPKCIGYLNHLMCEGGIVTCNDSAFEEQVFLEADTHMATQRCGGSGGNGAGVLTRTKGTHGPWLVGMVVGHGGQKVCGPERWPVV
jgi:hypothetical protein